MSINVYPDDSPNPVSDTPAPTRRNFGTIQVQMGGYEQLVRGEPMRAKFRDSWEKPSRQTGIGATRHLFLCGAVQGLVAAAAIVVAAWRAPDRVQSLMCKTRALTPNGGELPNLRPATEARARGEI